MGKISAANPFRFGVIVDGPFFTDRIAEKEEIGSVLRSANHLVLISPRRYGKSSLVLNVARETKRPLIYLNLQSVTTVIDFANLLLREILKIYPAENIRRNLSSLRGSPAVETDMSTGSVSVYFRPVRNKSADSLEDVLALIEKLSKPRKKPIVILDEFQEVDRIDSHLLNKLRAIMQMQEHVNYVFIGSEESMMERIFNSKKSPFYHFGLLIRLARIPAGDFERFVVERFKATGRQSGIIARDIVAFTDAHPYYTQFLSYKCFEFLRDRKYDVDTLQAVCRSIVAEQDNNYEKLWNQLNKNQQNILVTLSEEEPYAKPTKNSTYYAALRALTNKGLTIKTETYSIEDPFFKQWITDKRR
jgi:AAA+ ATPase superfamily predicted ATPase